MSNPDFSQLESIMRGVTGGNAVPGLSTPLMAATVVANVFVIIAVGMSLVSMAYSFIQFAVSQGDKDALDRAKTTLVWGGIGMFLALAAYTIKNVIVGAADLESIVD